jgi:hypothetical protein
MRERDFEFRLQADPHESNLIESGLVFGHDESLRLAEWLCSGMHAGDLTLTELVSGALKRRTRSAEDYSRPTLCGDCHSFIRLGVVPRIIGRASKRGAPVFRAHQLHHTYLFDELQRLRQYPCIHEIF